MEWFIHNRSERIGITALVCILMLVIVVPSFFPERKFAPEDTEKLQARLDAFHAELAKVDANVNVGGNLGFARDTSAATRNPSASTNRRTGAELFIFDPNTCDSASFCRLGFSPKQTASILRYRAKGRFRVKEDFKKMYVVSDEMYAKLENYIQIKPAAIAKIELNAADTSELKRLRGIGSYYARRIVEYRTRLGGFYEIAQLKEIKGIDEERFAQFADQAAVNPGLIVKIDLNSADEAALRSHPYISSGEAKAIVKYRETKGKIGSVQELRDEKLLPQEMVEKLGGYLVF